MGALRVALIAALALVGAQALVSDPTAPYGAGAGASLVTTAASSDVWSGRLESKPGYGTYMCYAKRLYGDETPSLDADVIRRVALDGPEAVPAAGKVPTAAEIAAWAAGKFNVSAEELVPEELSAAVPSNDWVDDRGVRHVRLIQYSKGWDATVELGSVIVHLLGDDAVLVTGGIIPDLESRSPDDVGVSSSGGISDREATAIALRAALSTIPDAPARLVSRLRAAAAKPSAKNLVAASAAPRTARVVHCSKGGDCRAAFKQVVFLPATTTTKPQELHVYVAAANGAVVQKENLLRTATEDRKPAKAPKADVRAAHDEGASGGAGQWMSLGRGHSLYSGEVPLNTAQAESKANGGPYQLTDLIHNTETYDMRNKDDTYDGTIETLLRDKDNQWGDGSPKDRQSAAVDAHYGASTTLTYYKEVHGRNGVDGRGATMRSRVHLSKAYDNAYWNDNRMTYGDGSRSPRELSSSCKGFPPMVTLDIAAHEMAHGVTEYTSGLVYEHSSGGINEALSDIMAQCVLDYAHEQGHPRGPDYLVGSQLFQGNCTRRFLRSMISPTADSNRSSACWHRKFDLTTSETHSGSDMWCKVDVHWSSGVANRAFWLMAKGFNTTCNDGSKPAAIGIKNACSVFYRSTYAYLSRTGDYYELRAASGRAASDLFGEGSPEVAAVSKAWDVVGVPRAPYPIVDAPPCDAAFATKPEAC
ncbi:peptidase [Raphidocelis subcapitata]|uniref:Peptidase n=1 Tax=Raphidocelis subcapitata TaxID=307507 RepID=A0A2V0NWL3_9CHLO|nr:peptidase [Raphidocelis subcapitata]|eukprot:GBF89960.1 peptidase [Raphidocelis subcapitata]